MSNALLRDIKKCQICKDFLPYDPNPIIQFKKSSKILIVGQAPGVLAHNSSKPWDDKSGERLREWLGITDKQFYNPSIVALVPMGFCYPGKGKSGDLPPRKECAEEWMEPVRNYLTNIKLEIYIGKYACDREFGKYGNLTTLIKNQYKSKDNKIVLPHPSPRNNIWLAKNRWFEKDALPYIKRKCRKFL
ncbi:uracil-DNA glycosylase family protein [Halobacteriovorax sp. JY17]|uniref:uracil-DNA glycosylase family protein n=1 Tax=Halobacteriovorax sp. JY17 TaxID=2014617 RepID=UPI0025C41D4B|nr:uracil-DNA glycosylase family protein [Halobacteriovorax sp. JY17]